ncbi:MAG: ABC transporter substrate-binding protein [Candidatus Omnitrophica bacterium]|nr:ABC transporter substrate-binding protein [Candidatus Omnitrophota bacterium]
MPVLAADPGITDTEILFGSSLALESGPKELGIQTSHGLMAYINYVNDEGGVNGRKIKVIFYNDGYDPLSCVQNTQKLINEDKVFALTSYVGTPTSVKAQPLWTNAKVPLVGFFTGAEALRTPFNRYNIHIRGSYYQETSAAVDIFIKQLDFKKIAVFYQNDAFGEAVKKGTEIALEKYGMTPRAYGSFERNTLNIEEGLKKIVKANPDAVVMVGTYSPLAKFVKEAKKAGLTKTFFHTVSFVGPETFAQELGQDNANVMVSQVVPPYTDPGYAQLPVIKKYVEYLKKYYPDDSANFVSLEGFINGMILVEGLMRAGKNLTRENFINAIESINPGEMDTGLNLSYGANDHVGIDRIYLTHIKGHSYVVVRN